MAEGNDAPETFQRRTECAKIKELMDLPLSKGDLWYLLDVHWFNQWKKYVSWEQTDSYDSWDPSYHPGPIDNSSLLLDNGRELREQLTEDVEFVIVPKLAWDLFVQWYTLVPDQQPITRKVVDHGMVSSYLWVEIYLTELKLAKYPSVDKMKKAKFSKTDSLDVVENVFRESFNIPESCNVRLWIRSNNQLFEELPNHKTKLVHELSLTSTQILVAEVQNADGSWPKRVQQENVKRSTPGSSSTYSSSRYNDGNSSSSRLAQPGLCGLNNLGNTCFMNSVLQCMSNTPPIARYFLEERHWAELNKENPLGNQGEIAKAFADLLKTMWSGNHHSFAPRAFKLQVGRFAPQFSGYQQHDSQELLTFLLDGLHEDLNRIVKKPYIELKDADGRSDEEVAQEAWENYRKRNDSVIVDLFHGLLKSTLVCPECSKISVTFDPTCYLSLPMPVKKERSIDLILARSDPDKLAVRFRVVVPKLGTVQDLIEALSKLCGIPADNLIAADVHQHRFHQVFTSETQISQISERDVIYVYELPEKLGTAGTCCLGVYLKETKAKNNYGYGSMFGVPFIIQVPREGLDYNQLYQLITNRMKRRIKLLKDSDDLNHGNDSFEAKSDLNTEAPMTDMENGNESPFMETNGIEEDTVQSKHLFTMDLVNSSGNSNLNKLKPNSKSIVLGVKNFITCDWEPLNKARYYEEEDQFVDVIEDPSYLQRMPLKKQVLQLKECLELFTSTERLGADDAWYCPSCKKHQRATKKFDLWSLPEVLVIHLKRFSYTRSLRDKLDTLVEFPVKGLNMAPYILNPSPTDSVYDLIGVCNHFGGLGGGHYTAYANNKDDNRWYYFDDSSVAESQEDAVCSKAAYVLFYIRRSASSRWLENVKPSAGVRTCEEMNSEEEMDSS